MSDKINNGELMTGSAINAKSEAPDHLHMSSEELDAVSGGFVNEAVYAAYENARQAQAVKAFAQALEGII